MIEEWKRHFVYVTIALIIGCYTLTWLMESNVISIYAGIAWSIVLSGEAVFYAVFLARMVEKPARQTAEKLRKAGYKVGNPQDLFLEFMVDFKPYYDAFKKHKGVSPERIDRLLGLMDITLKGLDKISDKQLGGIIGRYIAKVSKGNNH